MRRPWGDVSNVSKEYPGAVVPKLVMSDLSYSDVKPLSSRFLSQFYEAHCSSITNTRRSLLSQKARLLAHQINKRLARHGPSVKNDRNGVTPYQELSSRQYYSPSLAE